MCHEMLTQRALFAIARQSKRGMLSQHFVTHVGPPLETLEMTKQNQFVDTLVGS